MFNTMDASPPSGSLILFDGNSLDGWSTTDGRPAGWRVEEGSMVVVPGAGDICTTAGFRDHFLHLEFKLSNMPEASGQEKSNSGVFIQNLYEIQVLDSFAEDVPGINDCGAMYDQGPPLRNACRRPGKWQTYDIVFKAPYCEGSVIKEPGRITVFLNGFVVQNNFELAGPTEKNRDDATVWMPGPLRLQDHGNLVWYRNIWALSLDAQRG